MLDEAERYLALGRKYLEDGERLLAEADLSQASEKFWGAAAEIVKAVASSRGWAHDSHRQLFRIISLLAQEGQDGEIRTLFGLAHNLHVNFYDDYLPPDQVQDGAAAVRELIQRLNPMLSR